MPVAKKDVGNLLDSLYLEMLDLIEQQTACRLNIERLMNSGQLMLAKTRYLQGSQTISSAQIPTENSNKFYALCEVKEERNESNVSGAEYTMNRHAIKKDEGFVEPMHWFTVLPPSSLRAASEQFKTCLDFVLESANLQRELLAVMENIKRLKNIGI